MKDPGHFDVCRSEHGGVEVRNCPQSALAPVQVKRRVLGAPEEMREAFNSGVVSIWHNCGEAECPVEVLTWYMFVIALRSSFLRQLETALTCLTTACGHGLAA